MGSRYLIDSNVIIDYSANRMSAAAQKLVEDIFRATVITSVVVRIEVLGYQLEPRKVKRLESFFDSGVVIPLENRIAGIAIQLRRGGYKVRLGDAIIGATALANNLILVTRNVKDFSSLPGLKVLNPHAR